MRFLTATGVMPRIFAASPMEMGLRTFLVLNLNGGDAILPPAEELAESANRPRMEAFA
jgi:hypothetical protein